MLLTWITLLVCAMSFALSFAHLMELPARISWSQDPWIQSTVFGGLYRMFGSAGAVIAVAAVALSIAAAIARRGRPGFSWALSGAALYASGLALWFAFVMPMNAHLAQWLAGAPVTDFERIRGQWEYAHASIAALTFLGFAALARAALAGERN